jgi:hypothetical protein
MLEDFAAFRKSRSQEENGLFMTMNPGYHGRSVVTFKDDLFVVSKMDKPDFLDIV